MIESQEKPRFQPKDHYFWLDQRLAYLPPDALSKKALLLYILYARSCNPRSLNCSMASYEAARRALGLPRLAVDSAREELVQKGFIRLRPDVKPLCFKTTPVEVLPFPSPDNSLDKPGEGRCLKKTSESVMFVASWLVDGGFLKGLSLLELRTFLFLYAHLQLEGCLGVDFCVLHAWNPDNPKGAKDVGKERLEVVGHKRWWASKVVTLFLGNGVYQALNSLVARRLITLVPVVVWQDPEDNDIGEARRSCFVSFGKNGRRELRYWIQSLEAGEKVVWVVLPRWLARNSDYKSYAKKLEEESQGNFGVDSYKGEVTKNDNAPLSKMITLNSSVTKIGNF
jgi:hypothetical protein